MSASFPNSVLPHNIILIGMPGSGKTTVGQPLAQRLGWAFLDTDQWMEQQAGATLENIIAKMGQSKFLELEARTIRSLAVEQTVIATGGSVVYDERAMEYLRQLGLVVYLDLPLVEIEKRVGDLSARGVIIAPGMTVGDLYRERDPLYRRFAHWILPTQDLSAEEAGQAIIRDLHSASGKI